MDLEAGVKYDVSICVNGKGVATGAKLQWKSTTEVSDKKQQQTLNTYVEKKTTFVKVSLKMLKKFCFVNDGVYSKSLSTESLI